MAMSKTLNTLLPLLFFFIMHLSLTMAATDCPLDLSGSNFTQVATLCSNGEARGKCCRYINALIAVSNARYANSTSSLGVTPDLSEICLRTISETLELYGVTRNARAFCGLGTKIRVSYQCQGRTTVTQMMQSPRFMNLTNNCRAPLFMNNDCKKCLNAGVTYLRILVGAVNNMTLSICRDAAFVALASQVDNVSVVEIAGCFFGIQGILTGTDSKPSPSTLSPEAPPTPLIAASPSQRSMSVPLRENHHHYHLSLVPGLGVAVTAVALMMLVVLIFLIRIKNRELEGSDITDKTSKVLSQPSKKFQEGPASMFKKYSYKETKKATDNFSIILGQGGFGTVYKAQFGDGLVAAVKKMNIISEQAEEEFCKEIELLARLHHRHLVSLRGFCIERNERFLMYEYMANGSLKDHLHTPGQSPLNWRNRIQIAIDVANALEYLHFYCDPPLCHRDIKSSNILLDENFVAKVADFGLAHASKDGSIYFEPVNTDIRGTPGYMDPEYLLTQELTEKSDIYSYGVVLLELVTARRAIHNNKNLVEWAQVYMNSESRIHELVDPKIQNCFALDQLQTVVTIVKWCTQTEGCTRPSIKQVLRLLYECFDPMHSGFVEAVEEEDYEGNGGRGSLSKRKMQSWDGRGLATSSSTSRSYCSRSFLLETGSPQSPSNTLSI